MPRVDDTRDTLSGSRWFTTLDLISGCWQVKVNPEDAEKTAFCTHEGLFEFQGDALWAFNAAVTFQWLMHAVLAGLQRSNCLVYLDEVVIPVSGADTGGGAMGALAPPFPKVGGSTVCARAASRNYNWTIIL